MGQGSDPCPISIGTITMMLLYYEKLRSAAVPILNVAPLLKYVKAAAERVNEVTQLEKENVEGDIIFDRIEKLDLNYSYEQLVSMIATDNQTDTRILRFTVTDENAKEAKAIANELADATAERVAYVASDKPKVVEEAVVPQNPSSPNTKKNTLLGGLGLAFVAAAIILIKYLMDDTIMTEEDVKKYLGIHMLAAIPEEKRR